MLLRADLMLVACIGRPAQESEGLLPEEDHEASCESLDGTHAQ